MTNCNNNWTTAGKSPLFEKNYFHLRLALMMIHKNLICVVMTRSSMIGESQLELIICLTISFYFVFSERAFTDLVRSFSQSCEG